jgi:diguanylate cyclase (GGDEF)-like protein/PAS domain S-box-containing protein
MSESLEQLNRILATITDAILVVDLQGIVLYANQAAEQLLERPQLLGQSLAIPVSPSSNRIQDINLIRPSGLAWAEMRASLLDWQGKPAYVIGLHDITGRKLAEMALSESELMFHTLAKNAPVGIFRSDRFGEYQYVNQQFREIIGLLLNNILGRGWKQALYAEDREQVHNEWLRCVTNQLPFNMQYRFQHSDGSLHWVIGRAAAEVDDTGCVCGYVGTITEISELKINEEHLNQAAAVFESTREGVMITDANCLILRVNKAFNDITGYGPEEVIGQLPSVMRSGRHDVDFYRKMWSSITDTGHWQGEIWNRRKNGEVYPQLLTISTVHADNGSISHYVGVFTDISQLKASERELEFLAHHDPLTKLPNRILLMTLLRHSIQQAQRQNNKMAILMLDLDRFKDINDCYGHRAGDDLLQMVTQRLQERLRTVDTICRMGGDEFAIMIEDITHPEAAARIGKEIISSLSEPWRLPNGVEVRIGVSIGISLFPDQATSAEQLIQQADSALYQAKNDGRNCYKYFCDSMTQAARERIAMETRLRQALDNNALQVFYQPQINIDSGDIVGAEALVRWRTADGELIPPSRFIPIAEETGLITALGNWVLHETCRQGKQWLDAGFPALRLAVNLSSHQFLHSDINAVVSKTLAETGFPAAFLELELTESSLMKREQEAIDILRKLHQQGVHIAIDDFGTGYSSLAYLKMFPVDVLKIDKRFIEDIPFLRDDMEITSTIIVMAKSLRMSVIAEGVETQAQLDFLRQQNCDLYQGYLCSQALPAAEFETFWRTHSIDLQHNH